VKTDLRKLSREQLVVLLEGLGQPAWQADEVRRFLFARGVTEVARLTTLPKAVREELARSHAIFVPEIADRREAPDGTVKLLLRFEDGATAETVLMPQGERLTQCLSTQSGCPLACAFCRTGGLGFTRNLHAAEIVGQWLAARDALPAGRRVTNLVFMGMGEPLLNREALAEAVGFFTDPRGAAIAAGRVTVSTAGIAPGIAWLAERLPKVKLAVSLNAPDDALRSRLMPVNRTHPLRELLAVLRRHPATRHPITIEYVLLGGVNDAPEQARRLAGLLRGVRCKVNLIPFNPHSGLPFAAPGEGAVLAFQEELRRGRVRATVRRSQGAEIGAACGQLGTPAAPP
jgi:23S rRNA (adenine2503-C2)-methyltransferase